MRQQSGWTNRSGAASGQVTDAPPPPAGEGFTTYAGEHVGYDPDDPASLEAWFGNFGHAEHFRKVVLSDCREAIRAEYEAREEKVSEARLDTLARTHNNYIDWLTYTLKGRVLREQNVLASLTR